MTSKGRKIAPVILSKGMQQAAEVVLDKVGCWIDFLEWEGEEIELMDLIKIVYSAMVKDLPDAPD